VWALAGDDPIPAFCAEPKPHGFALSCKDLRTTVLTMIHANRARLDNGVFRVDRKFHVGMLEYARKIQAPLLTVNPESIQGEQEAMDMVDVPCEELPYGVMTLKADEAMRLLPEEAKRLHDQIARSTLVYGGGLGGAKIARDLGVPYVLMHEYDLSSTISVTTTQVKSMARKAVRAARCVWGHYIVHVPDVRGARRVHCNGYPIFDESKRINPECMLYLDSRMPADLIISEDALERRLAEREGRPLRLLFSGRYELIKGACDVVRVGLACLKRGLDVEMRCYGQGGLRPEMDRLVATASASGKIEVHNSVTYPELVELARGFDVFVCCHIQNDPSATYLEAFGSGLPIVGYGNRMWRRLSEESRVGCWSPLHQPERVADDIQNLISNDSMLATMSRRARQFALDHEFKKEFALRIDDLNSEYATCAARQEKTVAR
jgi:colanic acid/amylovoran biosynthesis glycosyltransferase